MVIETHYRDFVSGGEIKVNAIPASMEYARQLERDQYFSAASHVYLKVALAHQEIADDCNPASKVEQLYAMIGMLRCFNSGYSKGLDHGPDPRSVEVIREKIEILHQQIIGDPGLLEVLRTSAEQASSPLILEAFSGRRITQLREMNFDGLKNSSGWEEIVAGDY